MPEARIDLLQRMPVFGGVRADILQFLLGVCPIVSVPAKEYFFREHDQADSMFVLEAGKAVMDLCPRSASVRAVEDCTAIRLSAANLHEVYEQDLKQFTLIQMNMGREVTRRLREADNQLFRARFGPDADIEHVFLAG